jgi:hypothetical protein
MKELGINLYVIEGYYYKNSPQLTNNDCKNLLTVKYYDIRWQKERLLNILIEKLPIEIDCFGWFDADIIFSCDNLKEQCLEILKCYPVIQPWSKCEFLSKNNVDTEFKFNSMAYYNSFNKQKTAHPSFSHPGFAWCMRRKEWKEMGGFYDYNITGGGDTSMAIAFYNDFHVDFLDFKRIAGTNLKYYIKWAKLLRAYFAQYEQYLVYFLDFYNICLYTYIFQILFLYFYQH